MIDWTQPVETTETPPRPVRVLATNVGEICPVVIGLPDGSVVRFRLDGTPYCTPLTLRNVPVKPVLHERWVNLYDTYAGSLYYSEKRANSEAGKGRVECRRIAWNSDGSPVEDDRDPLCYGALKDDRYNWKAKAEALQAEVGSLSSAGMIVHLNAENKDLLALVDWMRPVVGAAVAWVLPELRGSYSGDTQRLIEAVRAYQNAKPATSDSHEAVVDAEVKNCTTCRWCDSHSVCGAKNCLGAQQDYRGWEVKS